MIPMAREDIVFDYKFPDDELHKNIGGGLPRNGVVLIEGGPGMGKSILAQRFLYGLLSNNNSVSYVSTELSVQGFLNQMDSLNYDIKEYMLNGSLRFASLFSKTHDLEDQKNRINLFFSSKQLSQSDIVIFDMINHMLVDENSTYEESYAIASKLKKHASQDKCVIVCVEQSTVNAHFYSVLANIADARIEMKEKEQYGIVLSLLKVHRMSSAVDIVESEVPFKVRPGVGIVVDISS